jgi:hypothetical protein
MPDVWHSPVMANVCHEGPFEQLLAAASVLPAGWRLEATAAAVVVTWSR